MYLPLDTVMLFRSEFLKELTEFKAEIYDYDDIKRKAFGSI